MACMGVVVGGVRKRPPGREWGVRNVDYQERGRVEGGRSKGGWEKRDTNIYSLLILIFLMYTQPFSRSHFII